MLTGNLKAGTSRALSQHKQLSLLLITGHFLPVLMNNSACVKVAPPLRCAQSLRPGASRQAAPVITEQQLWLQMLLLYIWVSFKSLTRN